MHLFSRYFNLFQLILNFSIIHNSSGNFNSYVVKDDVVGKFRSQDQLITVLFWSKIVNVRIRSLRLGSRDVH